jgi:hypothetical protein
VCQRFPSAPQSDDFTADLGGTVDNRFDDGIQTGDVSSAGQNPYACSRQGNLL